MDDVAIWIRKIGFEKHIDDILEIGVDGDLLLRLDESNLKNDLKMTNGILRKRFIRELNSLKQNADYSAMDRHGIAGMIRSTKPELMVYAYTLIEAIEPDFVSKLSTADMHDLLRNVANVQSVIHRQEIIRILDDFIQNDSDKDSLFSRTLSDSASCEPVYISSSGAHGTTELASLISIELQLRGFTVFESKFVRNFNVNADNEDLGCVLERSYSESLERCSHLILVLGDGALDDCMIGKRGEHTPLYYEIVAALKSKTITIIPVGAPGFKFPDTEDLLPEVRGLCAMNAVNYNHEYRSASMDKVERFIRGEVFYKTTSCLSLSTASDRSRLRSGRSTPYGSSIHLAPPSYNGVLSRSRYASSTELAVN